ncbi:MAG TPA: energy transducer TonB, partial [Paraburkholderia sp.]
MQASHTVSAGAAPASSFRMNPRVLTAAAMVAVVHVALLAAIVSMHHEPVQLALESRVMT